MKVGILSDTHGTLPVIPPECDALIHCGDVGPDRYYDLLTKRWTNPLRWFATEFSQWAEAFGKPIYMTWGNHDRLGQEFPDPAFWKAFLPANVRVCVDEAVMIGQTLAEPWAGRRVWFSPWSPTFEDWAWMAPEDELAKKYAAISRDVSVIVSHTPPYGYCDHLGDGTSVGSKALLEVIESRHPHANVIFCGHIHNGRGTTMWGDGRRTICWIRNVAVLDEAYRPIERDPILVVDWERCWPIQPEEPKPELVVP